MIFCFPRFAAIVISCLEESGIVVSHWPKDRKIAAEEAQESTAWKTFNSNVGAWLGAVVAGGILWLLLGTVLGSCEKPCSQMQQCESSAVAVSLCMFMLVLQDCYITSYYIILCSTDLGSVHSTMDSGFTVSTTSAALWAMFGHTSSAAWSKSLLWHLDDQTNKK